MASSVEGHELDEPDLDTALTAVVGQDDDLVVVDAALDDGVDLHRVEPGLYCSIDAVEHPGQFVTPGHALELVALQGVEADVDPAQPGLAEPSGLRPEGGAVRAEGKVDAQSGQLAHQHRQVGPHRGLPSGEADALDPEALHEEAGDPLDLFEGEHLAARHPGHALFGHAIGTAEVAAISDRDA